MNKQEIRAMLERRIRAWRDEDLETIMAGYAPDVVHVSPFGHRVGVAAMREANAQYLAKYTGFEVKLGRLVVDDEACALEWTWSEVRRSDGRRQSADDAIVFVVRDGLISYWREYFDTRSLW